MRRAVLHHGLLVVVACGGGVVVPPTNGAALQDGRAQEANCRTGMHAGVALTAQQRAESCLMSGVTPYFNHAGIYDIAWHRYPRDGNYSHDYYVRKELIEIGCDVELKNFTKSPPFRSDLCVFWVITYRPSWEKQATTLVPLCLGLLTNKPYTPGPVVAIDPTYAWTGYSTWDEAILSGTHLDYTPEHACTLLEHNPTVSPADRQSIRLTACSRGFAGLCEDLFTEGAPPNVKAWAQARGFEAAAKNCREGGRGRDCDRLSLFSPGNPQIPAIIAAGQQAQQAEVDRWVESRRADREEDRLDRQAEREREQRRYDEGQAQLEQLQRGMQQQADERARFNQQAAGLMKQGNAPPSQSSGAAPPRAMPAPPPPLPTPPPAPPPPPSPPEQTTKVETLMSASALSDWTNVSEDYAHTLEQAECAIAIRKKCDAISGLWVDGTLTHQQAFCSVQVTNGTKSWRCNGPCTMRCRH
jgi:hypothetical protein